MRVRASVNLPGNTPHEVPFKAGQERDVDSRNEYVRRMLNAGYLVQVRTGPQGKPRKTKTGPSE